MAAMIFKVPPDWGQCSMSISNTRLGKPSWLSPFGPAFAVQNPGGFVSSWAQLMETGAAGGGTSAWSLRPSDSMRTAANTNTTSACRRP